MDETDLKILSLLQQNADLTIEEVAKRIHLSATPCWKRIGKLKQQGYIKKTVALLDGKKMAIDTIVFVAITFDSHNPQKLTLFADAINEMPEVLECYRMSGSTDYLLKVLVDEVAAYDLFYKRLIQKTKFLKVTSNFAIETIKSVSDIPLAQYKDKLLK